MVWEAQRALWLCWRCLIAGPSRLRPACGLAQTEGTWSWEGREGQPQRQKLGMTYPDTLLSASRKKQRKHIKLKRG